MPKKIAGLHIPSSTANIPADYSGYIFVSDIDKTYLSTQIDSLGGLLRAAFETAERKANVPGFSVILRGIRRGADIEPIANPLFFVSASPPQLAPKLQAKMEIDGVEHDGIIFKNQLVHVRSGNFSRLREQLGFKLGALLSLWLHLPQKSKLVFFGDDSESDAVVFSIFAEILAKNLSGNPLYKLITSLGVFREEALAVSALSRAIREPVYPLTAAFINLESGSQPSYYSRFGPYMLATENSLQIALALFEQGLIREQAVRSVGKQLILYHDFVPAELAKSLEAGSRRGLYDMETLDRLWPLLHENRILPPPVPRDTQEGAVTHLSIKRWNYAPKLTTLWDLKALYSEEGRY